jgi:hypothetical protein
MAVPAAGIAALAAVAGQGISAYSTGKSNLKSRQFADNMYSRQRADALADQAMVNEYNSPAAQMKRLKAAGLNPNLVYGDGATTNAAPVRSSSPPSWKSEAPQFSGEFVGQSLALHQDLKMRQAQQDQLAAATAVAKQDAALKAAQIASTVATTSKTGVQTEQDQFNLNQARSLELNSLEMAKTQLKKLEADVDYTIDENDRKAAQNKQTLQLGVEAILNSRLSRAKTEEEMKEIRQRIENMKNDQMLKKLDIELKEKGIQPTDPAYMRILTRIANAVDFKSIGASLWESIKKIGAYR